MPLSVMEWAVWKREAWPAGCRTDFAREIAHFREEAPAESLLDILDRMDYSVYRKGQEKKCPDRNDGSFYLSQRGKTLLVFCGRQPALYLQEKPDGTGDQRS